jgi:hypothetical protein
VRAKGCRDLRARLRADPMLSDDVLNVMGQVAVLLAEQAILATVTCSSPDRVSGGLVHCLLAVGFQLSPSLEL